MKRREMLVGAAVTGAAGIAYAGRGDAIHAGTRAGAGTRVGAARARRGARSDHQGEEDPGYGGGHGAAVRLPRSQQPARRLGGRDRAAAGEGSRRRAGGRAGHGPQRIPALLAGRADVAISSLSMTFDRAKVVMFAPPHGALSIVIAGPKKTPIRSAADMAGKKIGLTRATLEEASVPPIAPPGAQLVYLRRHGRDAAGDGLGSGGRRRHVRVHREIGQRPQSQGGRSRTSSRSAPRTMRRPCVRVTSTCFSFCRTWVFLNKQNGVLANIYKKYTELALVDLPAM